MTHFASLEPYTRVKRNSRGSRRWAGPPAKSAPAWPVNEIVLRAHMANGLSREQIASRYGVAPERVDELREVYGV
jgi:hypothetical protein